MTRKKAREQAFLLFFEKSFHPETDIEDIAALAFDSGLVENDEYVEMVAGIASKKLFEIDEFIEENLRGWRKTRISKVSLAVMRLALCEMLFIEDVPIGVSINEAVEMCKLYSGEEDASFVNGVLGTVAKKLEEKKDG
ncbi:MAG: transcription antitermination factor NusB [Clostridiales bacterium]|jgi:N utilization substance protein B|nr:transcription antitermination factor NusB [Clostridiales bacterium]